MFLTTDALVLREVRYKEADKILTLMSSTDGKLTVKARGALRKGSKSAAATQQLTYSELTLFGNRGKWTVNEGVIKEPFDGLRRNIESFALGCFFAECLEALSVEDQPDAKLLQLGLNSLYALSHELYAPEHIKAAFELRLMCLAGYEPELSACALCGREQPEEPVLSLANGSVCCKACSAAMGETAPLCEASLCAMKYVAEAGAKSIFSFTLSQEALSRFSAAAERYLLLHTERRFSTLDYWKNIRIK